MSQVRIVYDPKTKKIRARCEHGGWVRFPMRMRQHGTVYEVENLVPAGAGSWIAKGQIVKVSEPR
jgi:hypothetical protein